MTDADHSLHDQIEAVILRLVALRGEGKTICPSEAARELGGPHPDGWGPLMQPVRKAAIRLKGRGELSILRKGRVVESDDFKGVSPEPAEKGLKPRACCEKVATVFRLKHALSYDDRGSCSRLAPHGPGSSASV